MLAVASLQFLRPDAHLLDTHLFSLFIYSQPWFLDMILTSNSLIICPHTQFFREEATVQRWHSRSRSIPTLGRQSTMKRQSTEGKGIFCTKFSWTWYGNNFFDNKDINRKYTQYNNLFIVYLVKTSFKIWVLTSLFGGKNALEVF